METSIRSALVYISLATWFVAATLMGVSVPTGYWRPLGIVSFVAAAVVFAFDRNIWRWGWVTRITGVPDLRGTWRGVLISSWTNPETGESTPPIEAYLVVFQTATSVQVSMMTAESRSSTITARLEKATDGSVEIVGVYRNEPNTGVRDRSPIHYGGLRLHVGGPPPTSLHGEYWTDRSTKGELQLEKCSKRRAADFASAQAICSVDTPT